MARIVVFFFFFFIVVVVGRAGWRRECGGTPLEEVGAAGSRGGSRGGCVFGTAEGEHEPEGVFAVQVEAVETFFLDEAEGGVKPEGGHVVKLGLERDLGGAEDGYVSSTFEC